MRLSGVCVPNQQDWPDMNGITWLGQEPNVAGRRKRLAGLYPMSGIVDDIIVAVLPTIEHALSFSCSARACIPTDQIALLVKDPNQVCSHLSEQGQVFGGREVEEYFPVPMGRPSTAGF
jgi:hypothetical protein